MNRDKTNWTSVGVGVAIALTAFFVGWMIQRRLNNANAPTALVCSSNILDTTIIQSSKELSYRDGVWIVTGPEGQIVWYEKRASDVCVGMPQKEAESVQQKIDKTIKELRNQDAQVSPQEERLQKRI